MTARKPERRRRDVAGFDEAPEPQPRDVKVTFVDAEPVNELVFRIEPAARAV